MGLKMSSDGIPGCNPIWKMQWFLVNPALFLALVLFGGSFLVLLSLHGLALLRLQGDVADVPVQYELQNECDKDDKEDSEEDGLVVEDGDSLIGGADGREPVELTHWSGGLGASRSVVKRRKAERSRLR